MLLLLAVLGRARDTLVPCGVSANPEAASDPVNKNATFHITTTTPPYVLCLRKSQYLDGHVKLHGRWQDCDLLRTLLRRQKGVYVDIGANIGACSMMMASLGHRVIGFEPTPPTFVALSSALAGNAPNPSWDVRLVNAGVSNASGRAIIQVQPHNAGGALTTGVSEDGQERVHASAHQANAQAGRFAISSRWQSFSIALTTLDEAVHEPVDLMKMDCQGHELRALLGATHLINTLGVRVIKFEFFPPGIRQVGDEPIALLQFLHDAGYELFTITGKVEQQLPPPSFASLVLKYTKSYLDIVAYRHGRAAAAEGGDK